MAICDDTSVIIVSSAKYISHFLADISSKIKYFYMLMMRERLDKVQFFN